MNDSKENIKDILKGFLSFIGELIKAEFSENARINLIFSFIMGIIVILFFVFASELYKILSIIFLLILLIFSLITVRNTNEVCNKCGVYKEIKRKYI